MVTVITVTYGERWTYLSRLLAFMATQPAVAQVIVVDNHSTSPIAPLVERLRETPGFTLPITVLTEPRNTGSAAAYGRALRHVLAQAEGGEPGFIYLLDDDNLPAPDALARLLERSPDLGPCDVLLSLRTDRPYLVDAVQRRQRLSYVRDAFCGNDVLASLARRLRLAGPALDAAPQPPGGDIETDYAPYGGMFFSTLLPALVGYPNADYFVYADDYEYVCRIRAAGGRVRVCADSRVQDLEQVWFDGGNEHRIAPWFAPQSSDFRVYYSVRNRVALERAWVVSRPRRYFAGGLLLIGHLALKAWRAGVPLRLVRHRLRLLARATRDGWTGRLGEVELT